MKKRRRRKAITKRFAFQANVIKYFEKGLSKFYKI